MPAVVRLSKEGLADLVENIKANGGDPGDLDGLLSEVTENERSARPVKTRPRTMRVETEEPTTAERLEAEVGELFPGGITEEVIARCIEVDSEYSLAALQEMCVEAGLSPGGHKKELAAKLIARQEL